MNSTYTLEQRLKQMNDDASLIERAEAAIDFLESKNKNPAPNPFHPSQTLRMKNLPSTTIRAHPSRMRAEASRM